MALNGPPSANAPRFDDLRSELLSLAAGKHYKIVDALGLIGQLLDTITAGNKPKPVEKVQA